jgi:MFS family permease
LTHACFPQAACLPFLSLYFKRIDLSSAEVGVLVAIQPLVSIVSCPLFGAIADRTKRHKLVLVLCIVISVSLRLLLVLFWSKPALPFGTPFGWLLCLMVVCEFIGSPIPSIVDTLVISLLAKRDAVGDCTSTSGRCPFVVLCRVPFRRAVPRAIGCADALCPCLQTGSSVCGAP